MVDPISPSTPQRVGGRRRHLTRAGARRSVAREVAAHKAVLASTWLPQPTAAAVLAQARTQLGKPYCLYGCRCDDCPCRDCSGEICYALNKAGYPHICTSSFGFAQVGRDSGLIIPKAQALVTPAAIGIRCPFCDPNRNGSNGHVWWCVGDGVHSIEEGGHATGCYEGFADKPGDVIYMLIPGVLYGPPPLRGERDMIVQTQHYNIDGTPNRPTDPLDAGDSTITVAADGMSIECRNDASIENDQPDDPAHPKVLRHWRPLQNPLPPGVTFVGVAQRFPNVHDLRPSGVGYCSDGSSRRFHLS